MRNANRTRSTAPDTRRIGIGLNASTVEWLFIRFSLSTEDEAPHADIANRGQDGEQHGLR